MSKKPLTILGGAKSLKAIDRTVARAQSEAKRNLEKPKRKVNAAIRQQFNNPNINLTKEEIDAVQAEYFEFVADAWDVIESCLSFTAVDAMRYHFRYQAEQQEGEQDNEHPADATGDD